MVIADARRCETCGAGLSPADADGLCPHCLMALALPDAARTTAGPGLSALDAPPALTAGATMSSYRILGLIGAGGMGEVYRAHDTRLGRDVAIKVVHAGMFGVDRGDLRLLREARLASQLNHPHICTVHDVGEADGRPYIAMELVEGESLSARLTRGRLPQDEVLRYALQLADALAHAHERGIVHRDLKGANIVITRERRVKILDFGLAKRLATVGRAEASTNVSLSVPGTVAGTVAYMAPEVLRGSPADARSDIWALGVVIYEMCAGKRPFKGQTDFELSSAILSIPPAPLPSGIDARLESMTSRCLEKDPALRIQRAVDVRSVLDEIAAGEAAAPARRQAGRVRLAVLPLQNLSGDATQDYFVDGMHEALITDLARLRGLRVIARSSVMGYRGGPPALPVIAEQLKVNVVLTGSVMRVGDRVRITAQLLSAADEEHLWAGRYDRHVRDILGIQNEIVAAIAREVHLHLLPEELARLGAARPVNPAAHEAYLKGAFHAATFGPAEFDVALQYYQLALDRDPDYALPYAGMAMLWLSRLVLGVVPSAEAGPRAKADVSRALELDSSLAEAHATLANITFSVDWDWAAAEEQYLRAIELNPSHADAHLFYSHLLGALGRFDEARRHVDVALELDPFNSFSRGLFGFVLLWVKEVDEAIGQFEAALRAAPRFPLALRGLWMCFSVQGRHEEALAAARALFESYGDAEVVDALARGSADGGFSGAMAAAADTLASRAPSAFVKPIQVAIFYDLSGDTERALRWLEQSFAARDSDMIYLRVNTFTHRLRATPEFRDLVRRMHLPSLD